jgi:hypothetical protein
MKYLDYDREAIIVTNMKIKKQKSFRCCGNLPETLTRELHTKYDTFRRNVIYLTFIFGDNLFSSLSFSAKCISLDAIRPVYQS